MNDENKFTDGKRRKFLATLITELYVTSLLSVAGFIAGWYRTSGIEVGLDILMIAAVSVRDQGEVSLWLLSHLLIEMRVARLIFSVTSYLGMRGGLFAAIEGMEGNATSPNVIDAYILFASIYLCWECVSTVFTIVARDFPNQKRDYFNIKIVTAALHVAAQALLTAFNAYASDRPDFARWERISNVLGGGLIVAIFIIWFMWKNARKMWMWLIAPITVLIQGCLIAYAIWRRGVQSALANIILEAYVLGLFYKCFTLDVSKAPPETPITVQVESVPPRKAAAQSRFTNENVRRATNIIYNKSNNM